MLHGFFPSLLQGASVTVQVQVPASLAQDPFNITRTLTVPPGFSISVFARINDARFMAVAPNGDLLVSSPNTAKVFLLRPDPNGGVPCPPPAKKPGHRTGRDATRRAGDRTPGDRGAVICASALQIPHVGAILGVADASLA